MNEDEWQGGGAYGYEDIYDKLDGYDSISDSSSSELEEEVKEKESEKEVKRKSTERPYKTYCTPYGSYREEADDKKLEAGRKSVPDENKEGRVKIENWKARFGEHPGAEGGRVSFQKERLSLSFSE